MIICFYIKGELPPGKKYIYFTFLSESPSKIINFKKKLSKLRKPFASYATFNI